MNIPQVGGKYRHYARGGEYEVLHLAKLEANEEDVVVYRALYDPEKIWVRPLSVFVEEVEFEGSKVPRFQYIGE
jgi:hypothetical protein